MTRPTRDTLPGTIVYLDIDGRRSDKTIYVALRPDRHGQDALDMLQFSHYLCAPHRNYNPHSEYSLAGRYNWALSIVEDADATSA